MIQVTNEPNLKAIFIAIAKQSRRQASIDFSSFSSMNFARRRRTNRVAAKYSLGFDLSGWQQQAFSSPVDFFTFFSIHFVRHRNPNHIRDKDFSGVDFPGRSQGACARPQ
jgi:hypothetical protein